MADFHLERGIYDALIKRGIKPEVAHGALASLIGESGSKGRLNTGAKNVGDGADGSDSIGFAQWNQDRADRLRATADKMGTTWKDPRAQLSYLEWELDNKMKHVTSALRGAETAEQGTDIWTKKFEVQANADATAKARMADIPVARKLVTGVPENAPAGPAGTGTESLQTKGLPTPGTDRLNQSPTAQGILSSANMAGNPQTGTGLPSMATANLPSTAAPQPFSAPVRPPADVLVPRSMAGQVPGARTIDQPRLASDGLPAPIPPRDLTGMATPAPQATITNLTNAPNNPGVVSPAAIGGGAGIMALNDVRPTPVAATGIMQATPIPEVRVENRTPTPAPFTAERTPVSGEMAQSYATAAPDVSVTLPEQEVVAPRQQAPLNQANASIDRYMNTPGGAGSPSGIMARREPPVVSQPEANVPNGAPLPPEPQQADPRSAPREPQRMSMPESLPSAPEAPAATMTTGPAIGASEGGGDASAAADTPMAPMGGGAPAGAEGGMGGMMGGMGGIGKGIGAIGSALVQMGAPKDDPGAKALWARAGTGPDPHKPENISAQQYKPVLTNGGNYMVKRKFQTLQGILGR